MKTKSIQSLIDLHAVTSIVGIAVWIPFPDVIDFTGAASLSYAFLFAVGVGKSLISYLALAWIPVFIICAVVSYIVARRKQKYTPFGVVVVLELLVSLAFIIAKLAVGHYTGIWLFALGFILRAVLFAIALLIIRKTHVHPEEEY